MRKGHTYTHPPHRVRRLEDSLPDLTKPLPDDYVIGAHQAITPLESEIAFLKLQMGQLLREVTGLKARERKRMMETV